MFGLDTGGGGFSGSSAASSGLTSNFTLDQSGLGSITFGEKSAFDDYLPLMAMGGMVLLMAFLLRK